MVLNYGEKVIKFEKGDERFFSIASKLVNLPIDMETNVANSFKKFVAGIHYIRKGLADNNPAEVNGGIRVKQDEN